METPPPSWYPDPHRDGMLRWWDGTRWTENVQPALVPGSNVYGSWEELATAADGTATWTPSRVFTTGDVVVYNGKKYKADWWTRNQVPGGVGGPWSEIAAPVPAGSFPAWSAASVYLGGETVTYLGQTYQAQWWTSGVAPGTAWSAWKLVG